MGKFSKLISIFITATMVTTMLTSCGAKTVEPTKVPSQAESTPASETESTPAVTAKAEPVEISVYDANGASLVFGQDDPVWANNPVAKKILEEANVKLKFEFPTGDGKEKLNLLLAGGDYPDIILGADDVTLNKMIKEKIAIPMDPLIEKSGPNIKSSYGKILDLLKMDDGHIYSLTTSYGEIAEGVTPPGFGSGFSIRKDVYEGVGSPKIETIDDIYMLLKNIGEKYPKNDKGEKVWPIGGFKQTWQNTMLTLMDASGLEADYYYINNKQLKYWVRAPYALTIVKFYNKLYREGLLDPESFTKDMDSWGKTKLQTARVLSHLGGWWMNWTVENDYKAAGVKNAENMAFIPFAFSVPGGQTPKLTAINRRGYNSVAITSACKNPDAAIKLLDFLASHDGNFMVQNGVEGIMWELKDGKPVMKPEFLARWKAQEADEKFAVETGLRLYHHFLATDVGKTKWDTYWIMKDDPSVTNDAKAKIRDEQYGKYWYDSFPTSNLFTAASDEVSNINTLVTDRFNNQFYACILAKTEAGCVAEFNKYVKDLDAAGLAKMEEYANKVYQDNLKK